MKKVQAAKKQLDRALSNLESAANSLEDIGLTPQAHSLDGLADRVEELRETLGRL